MLCHCSPTHALLNAVCTVPHILPEHQCLLMPLPVFAAGCPAARLAFTSSKHSPISCHHQPLNECAGAKLYFFGGSSCPMMTMGAAAPPVCLMPHKCCTFPLQNHMFFSPKVFLYSLCYYFFAYSWGGDSRGIQLHLKVCEALWTRPKAYKKCSLHFPSLHEISPKFF